MSSELVATYSALGTKEGDEYFRGPECLACVKDLIRALRHDDDHCGTRRHLGKAHVLHTDLIPLLVQFNNDIPLRNDVIRLLVNLTQPCCLCFADSLSNKDTVTSKCILEVSQYLRQYKEEFTVERVMNVLGTVLAELCQKDWENRDDDDIIIIERILLLIRNVLHVPVEPSEEKRTSDDVSIHDQIIWNIHINGIDELLLFLGSNPNETQWCMHVIEIIFLMLREQSAINLVRCGQSRSLNERKEDEDKMEELLENEKEHKQRSKYLQGSRHSNFGGSYTVVNQQMSSGNERSYFRPLAGFSEYSYDIEKRPRRTPHPKRRLATPYQPRLSTYSIRLVLKEFCIQVLEYCFNVLMRVVKDTINRHQSMDNDETYYLWTMKFFMEFSRLYNFRIIRESLQLTTVHQVLQLIANYYEHVFMNKRERSKAIEWGQRLQFAVQAYKELLLHIQEMTMSEDKTVVKSSNIILSNLLYHAEYRDVFIMLLRNYNEAFFPLTFLHDVIEMTHVYLRLVDVYSRQNGCLVIQKKRKYQADSKVKDKIAEEQLIEKWNEIENELQVLLTNGFEMVETPFPLDVTNDVPMEEQKLVAMRQIHHDISQKRLVNGLSLMKAAREIWPDDVFGSDTMTPIEDLALLQDLFMNPLSSNLVSQFYNVCTTLNIHLVEKDINTDEDETPHTEMVKTFELQLDLNKFTLMFANNKIIRVYSLVLANYKTNSDQLNHAVIKMFYNIAVKHDMLPMFFQITLFQIFLHILEEPVLRRYEELKKFSRHIVANFFDLAKHNSLAFAELLIWKTSGDCYDLKEGYGALQQKKEQQKNRTVWTREQEEELSCLYEQYKNENDIVGCILAALPGEHFRTRRIIASQLVSQGLVGNRKELHKKKTKLNKEPWSEEETFTLQSLWQPCDNINEAIQQLACYFPERGFRGIKQQLKNLGLIANSDQQANITDNSNSNRSSDIKTTKRKKKRSIDSLIKQVHLNGYSEQLLWLTTYINDEANDRELDNEWEELCIVTVEQSIAEALKTDLFCDLMNTLGLTPPSEQEMYWRIPSTLSPSELKKLTATLVSRNDHISFSDDNGDHDAENLSYPNSPNNTVITAEYVEESYTASEALAILREKRKTSYNSNEEQPDSKSQDVECGISEIPPVNSKKPKRISLFDDDDNYTTESNTSDINGEYFKTHQALESYRVTANHSGISVDQNIRKAHIKRNALFDDDDDDIDDNDTASKNYKSTFKSKKRTLSDSEDDMDI